MARTPKAPKLTQYGLNWGQKALISLFIFAFFYRWAFTDFTVWDAVKMPFGFAIGWVLVTPDWRRFLFSPEKWFKPSEWARKEPFQSIREFRNRYSLSDEEKYNLEHKVQNLLHICVIVPLLLVFGYFAFTPILNLAASYGVPSWGGFVIFIIVCWCVLMLLSADVVFERFSGAAFNIAFSDDTNQHAHEGSAEPAPDRPRRMEDFIKVGKIEPEKTDEFAFDPNAFAENSSEERSNNDQKAADLVVLLGGNNVSQAADEEIEESGLPEHHPDDLALWEVVNDTASTAEERKTALDMILGREADRNGANE